jgi:hypothetical protein
MGNWPVGVFVLVLVAGIVAVNATIWGVLVFWLRRRIRRATAEWAAQGIAVLKGPGTANYIGHASDKMSLRGTGSLILTDRDLRFMRIVPRREYVVQLAQITHLEQMRAWKGDYRARHPVVVVHYHDSATARDDAIGFSVRHAQDWLNAINAAASHTQ